MSTKAGQYVGFVLGNEHYGVDIMGVEEIIRLMEITPVPRVPAFVEGIINLRGYIIPVVDLRKRLGLAIKAEDKDSERIIVTILGDRRMGFIVDKVEQVMHISQENLDETPGTATKAAQKYVTGVARTSKGIVIILDMFKIFTDKEIQEISKIK